MACSWRRQHRDSSERCCCPVSKDAKCELLCMRQVHGGTTQACQCMPTCMMALSGVLSYTWCSNLGKGSPSSDATFIQAVR